MNTKELIEFLDERMNEDELAKKVFPCPYWKQQVGDLGSCGASVNIPTWMCEKLGSMTHDQCAFFHLEESKKEV